MKNYFFAALLFCASALTAHAQDGKLNVLYLDGQQHEIAMSKVAKLEMSGDNILLIGKDGNTVATHSVADVDKIELTPSTTGIATTTTSNAIKVKSNGYSITADGMTDGSMLEVYTAGGKLVGKATAKSGSATINASSLTNGVYVVKAEGQSVKMVKK